MGKTKSIFVLIILSVLVSGCLVSVPDYDTSEPILLESKKEIGIFVGTVELCALAYRQFDTNEIVEYFDGQYRGNLSYDLGREAIYSLSPKAASNKMKDCPFYKASLRRTHQKAVEK